MSVGERLKKLRVQKGLTQKELAAPHYSHAYVSTIEAGRRVPSRAALEHFGAKLGVGVDELVTGRPPELASQLALKLHQARAALSSGQADQAEKGFEEVRRTATRFTLDRLVAAAIEGKALCAERRGRLDEAIDLYDQALDQVREETPLAATEAVAGKARCIQLRGDIKYAIYLLENQLERLEKEGLTDPGSLVRLYSSLTKAYFDSGLYTKAGESAAEALRLAPRVDEPARLAQMHVNLTGLLLQRGEFADAEAALLRAQDLYRQAELRTELGRAYLARGYVWSRGERRQEARELFAEALTVFAETNSPVDEARVLNEIARLDRIDGRIPSAVALLERAIELLQENDIAELATAHRELAMCHIPGEPIEAEKHLRIAIDLFERAEENTQLAVTYRVLGDLLHELGQPQAGSEAYRAGIVVLEGRI